MKIYDIDKKEIEIGHILAVRYVWNSYAGTVSIRGLDVGGRYHQLDPKAHYQILGHQDGNHPDFRQDVFEWVERYKKSLDGKYGECPVKIRVYEGVETEK